MLLALLVVCKVTFPALKVMGVLHRKLGLGRVPHLVCTVLPAAAWELLLSTSDMKRRVNVFGIADVHPMALATGTVSLGVMGVMKAAAALRRGESCRRRWRESLKSELWRLSRHPRVATLVLVAVSVIPSLLQLVMAAETAKAMGLALRLSSTIHATKAFYGAFKIWGFWVPSVKSKYSKPVAAVVAVYCLWELLVFVRRSRGASADPNAVDLSSYLKIILDVVGLFAMGALQDAITNLELLLNTISIASVTASYETTQHMVRAARLVCELGVKECGECLLSPQKQLCRIDELLPSPALSGAIAAFRFGAVVMGLLWGSCYAVYPVGPALGDFNSGTGLYPRGALSFTLLCAWFSVPLWLLFYLYYTRHHILSATVDGQSTSTTVASQLQTRHRLFLLFTEQKLTRQLRKALQYLERYEVLSAQVAASVLTGRKRMDRMMKGIDYYLLKPLQNSRQRIIVATMATTNVLANLLNPLGALKKDRIEDEDAECPRSNLVTREIQLPALYTPREVRAVSIGDHSVKLQWEVATLPTIAEKKEKCETIDRTSACADSHVEECLLTQALRNHRAVDEFEIGFRKVNPKPSPWTTVLVAADEVTTPASYQSTTSSASPAPSADSETSSAGSDSSDIVGAMANDTEHASVHTGGRGPSVIPTYARCTTCIGKWSEKLFPVLVMASMCDCIVAFLGLIFGQDTADLAPEHLMTPWSAMAAIIGAKTACVCQLLEVEYPSTREIKTRQEQVIPSTDPSQNNKIQAQTSPNASKSLPFIRWMIVLVTAVLLLLVALWFRVRRQMGSLCGGLWFPDDRASATCFALVSPIVLIASAVVQRWWYLRQICSAQQSDMEVGSKNSKTEENFSNKTRDLQDRAPHTPSTAEATHMSFVLNRLEPNSDFEVRVRSIVHDTRAKAGLQAVCQDLNNDTANIDNPPGDTTSDTNREDTVMPNLDDDGDEDETKNESEGISNEDGNENNDTDKNNENEGHPVGEDDHGTERERRWCSQWSPAEQCLFQTALALEQRLSRPGRLMVNQIGRSSVRLSFTGSHVLPTPSANVVSPVGSGMHVAGQDMGLLTYSERRIVCDVQLGQQRGTFGKFLTITWTDHQDDALLSHMDILAKETSQDDIDLKVVKPTVTLVARPVAGSAATPDTDEVDELQVGDRVWVWCRDSRHHEKGTEVHGILSAADGDLWTVITTTGIKTCPAHFLRRIPNGQQIVLRNIVPSWDSNCSRVDTDSASKSGEPVCHLDFNRTETICVRARLRYVDGPAGCWSNTEQFLPMQPPDSLDQDQPALMALINGVEDSPLQPRPLPVITRSGHASRIAAAYNTESESEVDAHLVGDVNDAQCLSSSSDSKHDTEFDSLQTIDTEEPYSLKQKRSPEQKNNEDDGPTMDESETPSTSQLTQRPPLNQTPSLPQNVAGTSGLVAPKPPHLFESGAHFARFMVTSHKRSSWKHTSEAHSRSFEWQIAIDEEKPMWYNHVAQASTDDGTLSNGTGYSRRAVRFANLSPGLQYIVRVRARVSHHEVPAEKVCTSDWSNVSGFCTFGTARIATSALAVTSSAPLITSTSTTSVSLLFDQNVLPMLLSRAGVQLLATNGCPTPSLVSLDKLQIRYQVQFCVRSRLYNDWKDFDSGADESATDTNGNGDGIVCTYIGLPPSPTGIECRPAYTQIVVRGLLPDTQYTFRTRWRCRRYFGSAEVSGAGSGAIGTNDAGTEKAFPPCKPDIYGGSTVTSGWCDNFQVHTKPLDEFPTLKEVIARRDESGTSASCHCAFDAAQVRSKSAKEAEKLQFEWQYSSDEYLSRWKSVPLVSPVYSAKSPSTPSRPEATTLHGISETGMCEVLLPKLSPARVYTVRVRPVLCTSDEQRFPGAWSAHAVIERVSMVSERVDATKIPRVTASMPLPPVVLGVDATTVHLSCHGDSAHTKHEDDMGSDYEIQYATDSHFSRWTTFHPQKNLSASEGDGGACASVSEQKEGAVDEADGFCDVSASDVGHLVLLTGLSPSTTYLVRCRLVNSTGDRRGPWSLSTTVTTLPPPQPSTDD